MLLALGAVSSVLDALKTLSSAQASQPQATGLTQDPASPFDLSGATQASKSTAAALRPAGCPPIAPETMSALLAAQGQSPTGSAAVLMSRSDALKSLFAQVDANGDGRLSKAEFENALGAGGTNTDAADNVFSRMDGDSDGAVSLDEMLSALKGKRHRHHHHVDGGSGDAGATDGANSDPLLQAVQSASATSAASGAAISSYNFIEQMIAREARVISTATTASFSASA